MGSGWRRLQARSRTLRALLKDTHRALRDVADITQLDSSISNVVQELTAVSSRCQALVILGTSPDSKARLLHALLGAKLLPEPMPRGCRWIRIQFGSSTSVQLTLGNSEFELVGELECSRRPWDTLPAPDLLRRDATDLSTIVEVELNNPLLKDGLRIIIPPDLDADPGPVHYRTLNKLHKELYTKRELILNNYSPVYLFAIDEIGDNIFCDNISSKMPISKSEEDFWATFNLYNIPRSEREGEEVKGEQDSDVSEKETWKKGARETAIISGEGCLDLYLVKQQWARAAVLFVLLASATRPAAPLPALLAPPAHRDQGVLQGIFRRLTDPSAEQAASNSRLRDEQVSFMHELMDQWELMFPSPSKHYAKSQWSILDDKEALKNPDLVIQKPPLSHTSKDEKRTKLPDKDRISVIKEIDGDRAIKSRAVLLSRVTRFMTDALQSYLLENCTRLSEVHVKIVQHLILTSFSLARELQVVPKRIQYVATQEQQLYKQIVEKFSSGDKKQELVRLMEKVLEEMKADVESMDWSVDDLPCHKDHSYLISNSIFYSTRSSQLSDRTTTLSDPSTLLSDPSTLLSDNTPTLSDDPTSDVEEAESYDSYNFDDYEIIHSNDESLGLSEFLNNRVIPHGSPAPIPVQLAATLPSVCTSARSMSVNEAGLDVQKTLLAQLSRKINLKLDKFVDCLNDAYFGTLERCLEALERACRSELGYPSPLAPRPAPGGAAPASALCRAVRVAATRVSLAPLSSVAWRHALLHAVGRLMYRLHLPRGNAWCCPLSASWRRAAAAHVLHALPAPRLASLVASQIVERVRGVHGRFQASLSALEAALDTRLLHTEDVKLAIRKKHAPSFARLCLESTSMCDLLKYGVPELGREIGRGQYGVVYAVRGAWAGCARVAVKSVLPADERHCNELAMEFFYARSLPPHPHVLRLRGSLCRGSAVLLASERRRRDLHAAVRAGLPRRTALAVARDVIDGIRFLHSLGLVHRDIKMKNVLLDHQDRAALSDLGFLCSAPLVCGSLVGTPVHMAPELLGGRYDASVDVYAFGIMFWYLCAGSVKLPAAFEAFQNKEQLWSKVKRGLRPERLPQFRPDCWDIMESCWASDPAQRAHLGDIQPKLERILQEVTQEDSVDSAAAGSDDLTSLTDEDSVNEERNYL